MSTESAPNPKWWKSDAGPEPVPEGTLPPAWMVRVVWLLSPRAIRDDFAELFNARYLHPFEMIGRAIRLVISGYEAQSIAALRIWSRVGELALVTFCFWRTAAPLVLASMIVLVLALLTLRDGHTHLRRGASVDDPFAAPYTSSQYYLDCGLDAVLTGALLVALQAIAFRLLPEQADPQGYAYSAAFLLIPLLSAFRMAIRPNPAAQDPFNGKDISITAVCWWTRALTIAWMVAGTALVGTSLKAISPVASLPGYQGLTIFAFSILYRLPQNPFERDDVRQSFDVVRRRRARQMLLRAVPKSDPLYRYYISLQVLVFLAMLAPIAVGLWLFLAGRPAGVNMFQVLFNMGVFLAMLVSWNFVKITNHGASERLEQEIARLEESLKLS